ncbi:MAG TPA: methylenetetrahydrofolate reductase [NAD(P)H] [Hungateiclostridium thermocellum]|jgi:methylenetetrahydrofolate reductase (NADPH)|uniref:Methylenetetrahydrofolate reductase n=1 Tax=Acetivibrio thermocellus (strain ATCC 27405 / DSM 1237 / JCM 9322 / NBRC 103400 / NCIMB 10682 / NRRL B-4536 / VPI 7372) TaxID=203119 RepID=A3DBL1_ACET2|nr:methylenetetrahydrofolate reductase [NAD(P)H] [Acetivibrio thermocellus]CDG34782.1 5,10-methylenetetrahydrofolate reductase [Acetivibrio thermocellus BC1]ABN51340.1 5,10-methylenetetrahydrofolate reductase [Acetivibrio thermocellus ATCC 27405]ADU75173.1 5,10-methylenetetrahydrofolate reductase [Acetivibrio thermocellus DSM 1313]ANV76900.1 5,10-methylenetetrahydrofolate reductase [Acetivibrio thermocellus DSM 2360]NLU26752.1 methylenetetrahydrofolate reductase [NAD(P)H] [Acetivibrio thermoce
MNLVDLFKKKKPVISFEIFPPKLDTPIESIFGTLEQFKELKPDFISVTYGAGGSAKDRTIEIASKIKNEYGIESMAHLTCVGHSKEEIDALLTSMREHNLENILALRGDPPANQPDFDFSNNAFKYANELIAHVRKQNRNDFCIAAAAYVEGHVNSKRLKDDLLYLKQKVDTGVDFLVTQLFFDNRLFYDFLDKTASIGITCPITPGIMPIFKADQIKRITYLCGASIPAKLVIMMDKYGDNDEDMRKAGIEYASNQIRDLIDNGVDGIHLLTMNRPKSTREILTNIGLLK